MEMPGDNSQQILGRRQLERRYDTTIPVSFITYIYIYILGFKALDMDGKNS